MRLLLRLWVGPHRIEIDHLAVIGGFFLGPHRLHRQDAFTHQLEAGFVLGAVVFHLLDIPAAADAKDKPPTRQLVEASDAFRGDDRVALGNEADAGAKDQLFRRRRGKAERDKRVMGMRIALRQFAAGAKRRLAAGWDMRVLGHVERCKAALFEGAGELRNVDAVIDREIENTDPHETPPTLANFGSSRRLPPPRSPPRRQRRRSPSPRLPPACSDRRIAGRDRVGSAAPVHQRRR